MSKSPPPKAGAGSEYSAEALAIHERWKQPRPNGLLPLGESISELLEITSAPRTPEMERAGWERLREIMREAVADPTVRGSAEAWILAGMLHEILCLCTHEAWEEGMAERVSRIVGRVAASKASRERPAKKQLANANRDACKVAWASLPPALQSGAGVTKLVADKTGLSRETVREHLQALGLKKKRG